MRAPISVKNSSLYSQGKVSWQTATAIQNQLRQRCGDFKGFIPGNVITQSSLHSCSQVIRLGYLHTRHGILAFFLPVDAGGYIHVCLIKSGNIDYMVGFNGFDQNGWKLIGL